MKSARQLDSEIMRALLGSKKIVLKELLRQQSDEEDKQYILKQFGVQTATLERGTH